MKTKLLVLAACVLLTAQIGMAQTTGTITVTGTDPESFSITTDNAGSSLSSTVAFGSLTPGGSLTSSAVTIRLRSNKAYKITAQATALGFVGAGAADNGSSIALSDIGFGITSVANGGDATNVANLAGTHTKVALFDYDPGALAITNGLTPYVASTHGTLNDITSSTQILSGGRISKKGNLTTDNNYIAVTMKIGTLPQYFTPNTSFSTTVTLTISAN